MNSQLPLNGDSKPERPVVRRTGQALLGALFLGVVVPCVLVWVRISGTQLFNTDSDGTSTPANCWDVGQLFGLFLFAGFFCSPGALILGGIVLYLVRRAVSRRGEEASERYAITRAAVLGCGLAFLNLPGYGAGIFLATDPYLVLRLCSLFVVTGATCGAWIGWQVFKERNPKRGFFPRFSLRMLVLFALGWGVLLALYMPG